MTISPIPLPGNRRMIERRGRSAGPKAIAITRPLNGGYILRHPEPRRRVFIHRQTTWSYLKGTSWPVLLTLPVIYGALLPALLLDGYVSLYQVLCCRIYGIPRTKRADYLVLDRAKLPYLNWMEKLGCCYCSYFNGLIAYVQEIAGRTEQRFCPIKHKQDPKTRHARYDTFLNYGDADGYHQKGEAIQHAFGDLGAVVQPDLPKR